MGTDLDNCLISAIYPFFFLFYCSIVDLQCCVSFWCTVRWFSLYYICVVHIQYTFFFIRGYCWYKVLNIDSSLCYRVVRQEVNAPTIQGKVIRDSFSMDQNSKMRLGGQLREEAGPCSDHIFLFLKARDLSNHTLASSLEAKGELC